ncbi:stage II sporulation protein R [Paenibacillus dakarensis]|uniref:stage II sporulation protein R n=1 Tax=Paenibacillus dakarensis TaxID=1527293 RepID=UPI0006D5A76D|nr:stage II sporulation protein R [Paenibacillus dakarensis]
MNKHSETLRIIVKQMTMLLSILFMIVMIWEGQRIDAAVAGGQIPEESIRLRILANSDSPSDQLVKREIRDAVVAQMQEWVLELNDPQSLEEARQLTRSHLPQIRKLVGDELSKRGITYAYDVNLGTVPFPTKLYGGTVYPAGEYEAVRITLGEGNGQNWWCVLFPPLCFIDGGSGDAAAQPADAEAVKLASAQGQGDDDAVKRSNAASSEPEVRFFLLDVLFGVWEWITGLFA